MKQLWHCSISKMSQFYNIFSFKMFTRNINVVKPFKKNLALKLKWPENVQISCQQYISAMAMEKRDL